jgi:sulfate adenylyltransferase
MYQAHGGKLVQRLVSEDPGVEKSGICIKINRDEYTNIENLATGVYSPLEGFMISEDYRSVIHRGRLKNDVAWTIPVLFHIPEEQKEVVHSDEKIYFEYEGNVVGSMVVEDIYEIKVDEYARKVYGTEDPDHPGVAKIRSSSPHVCGGPIELYRRPEYPIFKDFHLSPKETRLLFRERNWKTVVAFQTRNVPHLGHEYVQKSALTMMDGLFINPVMGKKKKGDFRDEVILDSYNVLLKNYFPADRAVMSVLTYEMHYAGPKEAVLHAIMRQNFGCTHFIVGRDHAGVGDYYGPFDAHRVFDDYPDLKIEPVFFKSFFRCNKCASIANDKTCPHTDDYIVNFAGRAIRQTLVEGGEPSPDVMRPEVAKEILKHENPFVD